MSVKYGSIGVSKISNKSQGFTLVELLVVMTIIAILSTLASIHIIGYFASSRDSVRITDMGNIHTALNIFYSVESEYPHPDDAIDITYLDAVAWTQGIFGTGSSKELNTFGTNVPSDPKYKNHYSYSVANNSREYQLGGIVEGREEEEGIGELSQFLVPQAHANVVRASVDGDFNSFVVKVNTGGLDYYIATPSILASEISSNADIIDIILNKKLVYNDFFNIPAVYEEFLDTQGGFNFNVIDPIVFSGTLDDLRTEEGLNTFGDNLKYVYSTTPTESFDTFRRILDADNTNTVLKDFLKKNFGVTFKDYFDCKDMFDDGQTTSGNFQIDPDGVGPKPPRTVYCDMVTGGGGWTRKDITKFSNGSFEGGANISSLVTNVGGSIVTLGSSNTPVTSPYALRQQGVNSHYEIQLEDQLSQLGDIDIGDELRLSLWVRDDGDASATSWSSCTVQQCLDNPSQGYMFRNIFYGNDGLNIENGYAEVVDTLTTADGREWKKLLLRKKVLRSLDDFWWKIGYGYGATKDIYITGVDLEVYYGGYQGY